MGQGKRKIARTQRDKVAIQTAKILKKAGIISKQAKLHGGKYISKEVLRKTREYAKEARMGFKAYPVSKKLISKAKSEGFKTVAGTKIIGPKTAKFRSRIAKSMITGVLPIKGGMLEKVILAEGALNISQIINRLKHGIDNLKEKDEFFSFKIGPNIANPKTSHKGFKTTEEMLEFMTHYKFWGLMEDGEDPESLEIFKAHRDDINILVMNDRAEQLAYNERERKAGRPYNRTRKYTPTGRTDAESYHTRRLSRMSDSEAARYRKKVAGKSKKQRENQTPEQRLAYRLASRSRASKSYYNRKRKK